MTGIRGAAAGTGGARPRVPATLLAVAAIFSVQFGNAIVGSLFGQLGPSGAAALRLALAAAILLLVVRPRVRSWRRRTWLGAFALGVGLAGMNLFIYLAIAEIPQGVAVTIELLGPLAIAASGVRRLVDAAWVLLALGGIALLSVEAWGGAGSVTLVGALCAGVAAAFWALYIIASSKLASSRSGSVRGIDGLAVAMAFAALFVAPVGAPEAVRAVAAAPPLLAAFAGVALLTSVIPYALEFIALKRMPAWVFGVLSSLGPAVAALAGLVVLGQQLTLPQLGALILVVAASVGVVLTSRPPR